MNRLAVFLLALLAASCSMGETVKLHCWIVGDDDGRTSCSASSIQGIVDGVNQLYAQVAMSFAIGSVSCTNDTRLSDLVYSNAVQRKAICAITNNTDGLELYFIRHLEGRPTAFYLRDGIVVGPRANVRSVAHEIGHACGMKDVYDRVSAAGLSVEGPPSEDRMPLDKGWYPSETTQADILKRLLMYGYTSDTKADIPFGDVYGIYRVRTWDPASGSYARDWRLGMAPVGFEANATRSPVSQ